MVTCKNLASKWDMKAKPYQPETLWIGWIETKRDSRMQEMEAETLINQPEAGQSFTDCLYNLKLKMRQ